MIKLTRI